MKSKYQLEGDSFFIEGFNAAEPFADFFPALADLTGKPMWAFFTNRGQAISSFGVNSKGTAMLEFLPANKAYQATPLLGFRTFLKGTGRNAFQYEPFSTESTPNQQTMVVRPYELEIRDREPKLGIETTVVYFGVPNEDLPVFVRSVTLKNLTGSAQTLQVVDGLPRVVPFGMNDYLVKHMSRTIEAFAEVLNIKEGAPFFKLKIEPSDRPEVEWLREGFFSFSLLDGDLMPVVVDPSTLFGFDTAFLRPRAFFENGKIPTAGQLTSNIMPASLFHGTVTLPAKGSVTWNSYYGFAQNVDEANHYKDRVLASADYFEKKRAEMKDVYERLVDRFGFHSGNDDLNQYARVTFMDNTLRGGFPLSFSNESPIVHVFSRKHGDMERDYNSFLIPATYYSQGNGNFRDVSQNRRNDPLLNPHVGSANVDTFFNLLQLDGYNPLIINPPKFIVPKDMLARLELRMSDACKADYQRLIREAVQAGDVFEFIKKHASDQMNVKSQFMDIMKSARVVQSVEHGEGFWIDHWTYNLDHLDQYLSVFPDKKSWLLYEKKDFTFFDSDHFVRRRSEKYSVAKDGRFRQYNAVVSNPEKKELIAGRPSERHKVRTEMGRGEVFTTNLFTKLLTLAAVKSATLDPFGVGIEMEADKPGWCDALNGCPGLFGSSTCEMFELMRLVRFLREEAIPLGPTKTIDIPHELHTLIRDVEAAFQAASDKDFRPTWDRIALAREIFRERTFFGISGRTRNIKMSDLEMFFKTVADVLAAAERKALDPKTGLPSSYFFYDVDASELGDGWRQNLAKLPWRQHRVAPFLEGVVHALKTSPSAKASKLYQAVKKSPLFDRTVGMYRLNAPLHDEPTELGRIRIFSDGWLENASIFLHMHYKYLLEVLRSGQIETFLKELPTGLVPFRDAKVYGRPTFQNCSFIASSAFPNPEYHGRGFVARLSGATSEFMSMVYYMAFGPRLFTAQDGKIVFSPSPQLPKEWFTTKESETESGSVPKNAFMIRLFEVPVIYLNEKGRDSFGPRSVKPARYEWILDGRFYEHKGRQLPPDASQALRDGRIEKLTVFLD